MGPRAEPRTATAETGGEAARALQRGGAAPLPPARRGSQARRGAPRRARASGPREPSAEGPAAAAPPRPSRGVAGAPRAEKGPRHEGLLAAGLPGAAALAATLTRRSWYRTAHADRRDRHGKLRPGASAHGLRHSNGAALHAGPRPASLRLRPRRAGTKRPLAAVPRPPTCEGSPLRWGAPTGQRWRCGPSWWPTAGPSDTRQCRTRASRPFLQQRLLKRAGGEGL